MKICYIIWWEYLVQICSASFSCDNLSSTTPFSYGNWPLRPPPARVTAASLHHRTIIFSFPYGESSRRKGSLTTRLLLLLLLPYEHSLTPTLEHPPIREPYSHPPYKTPEPLSMHALLPATSFHACSTISPMEPTLSPSPQTPDDHQVLESLLGNNRSSSPSSATIDPRAPATPQRRTPQRRLPRQTPGHRGHPLICRLHRMTPRFRRFWRCQRRMPVLQKLGPFCPSPPPDSAAVARVDCSWSLPDGDRLLRLYQICSSTSRNLLRPGPRSSSLLSLSWTNPTKEHHPPCLRAE